MADPATPLRDEKSTSKEPTKPAPDRGPLLRQLTLRGVLRPHLWPLLIGFTAVLGETAANLLEPWPVKIVVDTILHGEKAKGVLGYLTHRLAGSGSLAMLKFAVGMVLAVAVLDAVSTYTEKYLTTSVGQWITHDLRRSLYAHIQRLSLAFHDQARTGDLLSRATDDIDAVQSFITTAALGGMVDLLTLVGMIGWMLYLNWRFTLIALSIAPIMFAVVFIYTRRSKQASRAVRKKQGEIVSVLQEVFTSIRLIKAFAREKYEVRRLEEESLEGVEVALKARSLKAKLVPLVALITACGTAMVLWFGARMVFEGHISAGTLVLFVMYLRMMYKPMQDLSQLTDTYSKAAVGWERVKEIFSIESEVRDRPHARPVRRVRGEIEFDHVSFHYQPDRPVLQDVNFHIKPGELAALVGPTGAGKSTIISLVARFYDPTSGVIRLDGVDIRDLKQESLRRHISFVLQQTVLFRAPLWQNIAYGKPDATRDEIERAAQAANATEFIDKLPEGYNTMVGERGVTLSGGQAQRIAIARAVIRQSPILIMDEPSSGLDAASEALVFEALDRLMKGKTSIVIAHRLSTVRSANCIFVVQDGGIAEQGNHDELMRLDGIYAGLSRLQTDNQEVPEGTPAGTAA